MLCSQNLHSRTPLRSCRGSEHPMDVRFVPTEVRISSTEMKILQILQEEFMTQFPAFPEAFGQLIPAECPDSFPDHTLASDGEYLYLNAGYLQQIFLADTDKLKKIYFHLHLHCLCLHVIQPSSVSRHDWDLACDLSAELLADLFLNKSNSDLHHETRQILRRSSAANQETISLALQQLNTAGWLTAQAISSLFADVPELRKTAAGCALDSHHFWLRPEPTETASVSPAASCSAHSVSGISEKKQQKLNQIEKLLQTWRQRLPVVSPSSGNGPKGKAPGMMQEEAELRQRDTMDYHRFLRQFAVAREEAILDMDAFDYIPYYYGLECYGKEIASYTGQASMIRSLPFLEPLEYKEVNRLDEFAIAIDTSASCSGTIVQRFLEETWSILRQRENFFSKIRIHLIQCDSMIQDHQIFTSSEQWEDAMAHMKIHGFGNTDFRPVFEYLEKLIRTKEIHHLRGLLYFTDGDGIFPSHAPEWDTAFVFLNRETEKHAIPDWGIRLNLHIPDISGCF